MNSFVDFIKTLNLLIGLLGASSEFCSVVGRYSSEKLKNREKQKKKMNGGGKEIKRRSC